MSFLIINASELNVNLRTMTKYDRTILRTNNLDCFEILVMSLVYVVYVNTTESSYFCFRFFFLSPVIKLSSNSRLNKVT